ncbi:hypothetical protein ACO22_03082 [Paracoccidioides brasiliensis]|uniref:Uncharacterized protein n=1 Tax=Paracoccidioides brasiliensis TaxID=121759 RepID=A0A1D2JGU1_PARBR|nr:hypothetical protein ACO22_03082 [Paracoccidioides brasiliensis]ODH46523.1 hypothetical protein GX48_07411 [Paracoccidioides brasiliensis]
MANLSQGDRNAIEKYPLNDSLSHLQDLLQDKEKFYMTHPICYDGALDRLDEACQKTISRLAFCFTGYRGKFLFLSQVSAAAM